MDTCHVTICLVKEVGNMTEKEWLFLILMYESGIIDCDLIEIQEILEKRLAAPQTFPETTK